MKIFDFITEIKKVVHESVPGDFRTEVAVYNEGENFSFNVSVEYTDPGCIITSMHSSVAYIDIELSSDLSYRVVSNSVYPDFNEERKAYNISEFPDILREKLSRDRAQILFKSIIGK
jgi:hypothetical protein